MVEYMRCTSNTEEFKNPVEVFLRGNLIDCFYDLAGKEMKSIGAHFFGHNLIKNYRQKGHTTSSFTTNLDWQEKYWRDYWDHDPVHSMAYPITQINVCAITPWKVVDPDSDCMEDRKAMCRINDGLTFWMKHDNEIFEHFSFGWEKYDISRVNRQKLAKLCNMITDFRIQHFRLNRDMFDVYPAVDFY